MWLARARVPRARGRRLQAGGPRVTACLTWRELRRDKYLSRALVRDGTASYNAGLPGAGWSSLAARRAHNPKVAGSKPAPATNRNRLYGEGALDLHPAASIAS